MNDLAKQIEQHLLERRCWLTAELQKEFGINDCALRALDGKPWSLQRIRD